MDSKTSMAQQRRLYLHQSISLIANTVPSHEYYSVLFNGMTSYDSISDAIIRSKLLYGLETVELTNKAAEHNRQYKIRGLRKVVKMKQTAYDRTATDEAIFEQATHEILSVCKQC